MTAPQATPASATRGRFALRRLGSAVAAVAAVAVVALSVAASAGAALLSACAPDVAPLPPGVLVVSKEQASS